MKKIVLCILICSSGVVGEALKVSSQQFGAIPLLLGYVVKKDPAQMEELVSYIQKDFSFTQQFGVTAKRFDELPSKKEIKQLSTASEPYLFALFVTPAGNNFEWCLYDVMHGKQIAYKKYKKSGTSVRGWAHNIADMAWTPLTSQEGFFSTRITYAKQVVVSKGKQPVKHIYIADYDGSHEEALIHTPTINVAPRWNGDLRNPLIFYSDFTKTNVRLMVSDLAGKKTIASDFDGLNMIPAFSKDGKKLVYCLSRGDGSCQLYLCEKGVFRRITHNTGNNISPTLADNGKTVYFCSDYETGSPQIYGYHIDKDELERITDGGYCAAPRYCEKMNKLAYGKLISGTMQLFIYDLMTKKHEQITFNPGNKEEYSWSPCGTKLIYNQEIDGKGRIAMINLHDRESYFITAKNADCSYPDWSPVYKEFPVMMT